MLFWLVPRNRITQNTSLLFALFAIAVSVVGQESELGDESYLPPDGSTTDNSTTTYPAEFFTQYKPISARDMLDRIPGIDSILGSEGDDRRGLGAGEDQILINGKRTAGKENDGRTVLEKIAAAQVKQIDIVRGASAELDIRGSGPTVNVILREDAASATLTAEINGTYYGQDGTSKPGGILSLNGRGDVINYLLTLQVEPQYQFEIRNEFSVLGDGISPKDQTREERRRQQTDYQVSSTLGYQLTGSDLLQLNGLFKKSDPPDHYRRLRTVLDPNDGRVPNGATVPFLITQDDFTAADRHKWEFGSNYVHDFDGGTQYKLIVVVSEELSSEIFNRFSDGSGVNRKTLFIDDNRRTRERIVRGSFLWTLAEGHDLEVGLEVAQNILDSRFDLGDVNASNPVSPKFGNINAGSSERSVIEEIRYEPFAVHNWQINSLMALETSIVAEFSELSQDRETGIAGVTALDSTNTVRDFSFWKPKVDFSYDITPATQFGVTVDRDVSQLDFRDFTARQDGDLDSDSDAGNPDLVQEKTWRYETSLEYRLPNDGGVLDGRLYYHAVEDVADRVDVSFTRINAGTGQPQLVIASAPGNIGDGKRFGIELNGTIRLSFLDLPDALLTGGLWLQKSEVTDPFTGETRRFSGTGRPNSWDQQERGNWNIGYQHDVTSLGLSYGFDYRYYLEGGNVRVDIDDIARFRREPEAGLFIEKAAFNGIRLRLEVRNILDSIRCLDRTRFDGFTADNISEEEEKSCIGPGRTITLRMRTTF